MSRRVDNEKEITLYWICKIVNCSQERNTLFKYGESLPAFRNE